MAQNNPADVFTLGLDNDVESNIDFYTSIQDRLARVGEEFFTYSQSLWSIPAANFLNSSPGNNQMDDSWEPVRALGKGSFGVVGLWRKTGRKGEVEDEIAIKEMRHLAHSVASTDHDPRLAKEAVIMRQLNDAEQRRAGTINNILRLRSFKNFPAAGRWRFYLEFAPHGDLHKLVYSYKAWDNYLPEEFLWHTFNSLAKAAVIMEQGPFIHPKTKKPTDWSVTHFDIKPENIHLGKPDKDAIFENYPTIKVADFGLTELTGGGDRYNPLLFWPKGTDGYQPPVGTFGS
jgi:serine/threonine protein kinase